MWWIVFDKIYNFFLSKQEYIHVAAIKKDYL